MSSHLKDWIPEILAVAVFGGIYTMLAYLWFLGELSTMGSVMMWLGFILSLLVIFGVERVREALSVASEVGQ